ncbi:arginine--tRNA ligase [Paenibacillus turpanensis]|uniref:arginine--tRNA ligase n=1 Tax=Paenibacillus turpanensis TaxID=2689078 RepID=UPI0014094C06|nr:arginine--tRNA ligase [Paenibacillus turpanensis]
MAQYVLEQVKQNLKAEIENALHAAGLLEGIEPAAVPAILLDVPREKAHGDFASNIAMQLTRLAKKNPRQIAEAIVEKLDTAKAKVSKVEIAGPGFINFHMDKTYLLDVIGQALQLGDSYGSINDGAGQRVQVEFVSANPTGSLHLGHARGAAVGDALCSLLSFAGYDVSREYYINDAGNQIANLARSLEARYLQALGRDAEMPEDGYHGQDIIDFAAELAKQEGDRLTTLSEEERFAYFRRYGLDKEMAKLKRDLERFRVNFDVWYSETSLYENGKVVEALNELRAKGHVYDEEGAVWLRTTPLGDDKDRVLVKNDGSYTYLTPDIAYHRDKFERGFDRLINIWGADHHGYIPRMKAAMTALGYDAERLMVLVVQMVSLFQNGEKVKMSKRTGKAVTMEDLMDEVGIDATRYFFTMRGLDTHLDFDMDLAVSKSNENPVYYVQYAHARICSVFRQAEEQGIAIPQSTDNLQLSLLNSEATYDLLLKLGQLPEEVRIAAGEHAPHRMIRYVYELASQFHSYYRAERVITEDAAATAARLAVLGAVKTAIANVLRIVGVSAPEQM